MFKDKIDLITKKHKESSNKKKIENLIFLIVILIITLVFINYIIKDDKKTNSNEETNNIEEKSKLATNEEIKENVNLKSGLEEILSSIKGAGYVKVFLNYSESSSTVAMYDETTTTSATEENDSSGGKRNVTETENKKNVIYSEENGNKTPITEKTVMPKIVGAIVTAEGAGNVSIKTKIINAVSSITGLTIDKIQVFEMK